MVNAISSGSPVQQHAKAMDKVSQEQLYGPGAYTVRELLELPPLEEPRKQKESGGFLAFLGKTALLATAVGLTVGLLRVHTKLSDIPVNVKPEGVMNQAKYYAAKLGDFVNEKVVAKVAGWFKKIEKPIDGSDIKASPDIKVETPDANNI